MHALVVFRSDRGVRIRCAEGLEIRNNSRMQLFGGDDPPLDTPEAIHHRAEFQHRVRLERQEAGGAKHSFDGVADDLVKPEKFRSPCFERFSRSSLDAFAPVWGNTQRRSERRRATF